jgi:hypothetical protein
MQYSLGRKRGDDKNKSKFALHVPKTPARNLPAKWVYNYDERPIPYDQGPYSDCVSNAVLRLSEFEVRKRTGKVIEMSRRAHYCQTKVTFEPDDIQDDGMFISDGLLSLERCGHVLEAEWPYPSMDQPDETAMFTPVPTNLWDDSFKTLGHVRVDTSLVESTKLGMFELGILAIGVAVPAAWMEKVGPDGLLPCDPNDQDLGGHCPLFDGWDDERFGGAFRMPNSWGLSWGESGVGWMPYSALHTPWFPSEAYGIVAPG